MESAICHARRQVQKKDVFTTDMLVQLRDNYKDVDDLIVIRDLSMILISFRRFSQI